MTRDMADALLFAFTTNHQFVVKGRNIGKTAAMNLPFRLHKAQQITFDQLSAAYDKAMKQNSNPYQVPPHRVTTSQVKPRAALDIGIEREILPAVVAEVKDADLYSWHWQGFQNTVRGAVGRVMMVAGLQVFQESFVISRDFLERSLESQRIDPLINEIEWNLKEVVTSLLQKILPPHDINTCKDPECMC